MKIKRSKTKTNKRKRLKSKAGCLSDFFLFINFCHRYIKNRIYVPFSFFESVKDLIVVGLYKDRGKKSKPIMHMATMMLAFAVVMGAPLIFERVEHYGSQTNKGVLAANSEEISFYTIQAEEVKKLRGGEVTTHLVQKDQSLEDIAEQYGLRAETILWENNLKNKNEIKEGSALKILPIDGVRHKVAKGETIWTIGKKYGLDQLQAQAIIDFPFNDFLNDETFELAVGQFLMVPGGVKPQEKAAPKPTYASVMTPSAGAVSATGSFVWPAAGRITQGYFFYHKAIDIAGSGAILAVDSGTVVASGWDPSGYGNKAVVDHGNGLLTLYAHMSALSVSAGQTVNRGDVLGQMGSTGRSTGVHLHFEVRQGSVLLNPLNYLR